MILRTMAGCQPSPGTGAGNPAGMPGFMFARVPGDVVASLLDHRLRAGKPPASWQMDAEISSDEPPDPMPPSPIRYDGVWARSLPPLTCL